MFGIDVAGLNVTEVLSTLSTSEPVLFDPPDGTPNTTPTDAAANFDDFLFVEGNPMIPSTFSAQREQSFDIEGFGFPTDQLQTYFPTFAEVQFITLNR